MKTALEQEEELAKHVAGYTTIAAAKDNLKGFYNTKTSIKHGGGITASQNRFIQDNKEKTSSAFFSIAPNNNSGTNNEAQQGKHVPHHHQPQATNSNQHLAHNHQHNHSHVHPHVHDDETFHHHLSYYRYHPSNKSDELPKKKETVVTHSWLDYKHEDDDLSLLANLPTSPNASAQANLLRSLAKLENERKLLNLVDRSKRGNTVSSQSNDGFNDAGGAVAGTGAADGQGSIYNSYDDASCADIFIDQEVLSHSALTQSVKLNYISSFTDTIEHDDVTNTTATSTTPSNQMTEKTSTTSSNNNIFKTSIGLELDLHKLNQIHFFADSHHNLEELETILGVCFIRDKKSGQPLFQNNTKQIKSLLQQQRETILQEKKNFEILKHPILQEPLIVIIRHGKTEHNQLGLFTGWEDAALAEEGREEAMNAGRVLRAHGIEVWCRI